MRKQTVCKYGMEKMTDPETVVTEDNAIECKFAESDENGNEKKEGGINKANSLLHHYFSADTRSELLNKRKMIL